jgi:hypothetical protein
MKNLLQLSGLILIIIAVIILVFEVLTGINDNSFLIASGILLIAGLVVHVVLNKKYM